MFKVSTNIIIGDLTFDFVASGSINSSWKNLTDTAKIVLPKKVMVNTKGEQIAIQDIIKKGDKVQINLGYDGELNTEFMGYVSSVNTGIPTVIECEDDMWQLKQQSNIQASWKNAKLADVVAKVAPNIYSEVLDVELGAFRINDVNAAQVLGSLREYGLNAYFRNGILYVGFRYPLTDYSTVNYHFQQNVVHGSNNLSYRKKEDVKIKVKATSILTTNEKIEVELGDPDGALRSLHYYNLSEKELRKTAERDLEGLKLDGLRGSFRSFALPFVQHGDVASITDEYYPDHNGDYFIDSVKTEFGYKTGIKRTIELGRKA